MASMGATAQEGPNGSLETTLPEGDAVSTSPTHPLGVLPLGNKFFFKGTEARTFCGTFQRFPEEMLSLFLEYLDQESLRMLGYTCRYLYAFAYDDALWKSLFLEANTGRFEGKWLGSWRSTVLKLPAGQKSNLDCSNVFSDVLHRPFVCRYVDLEQFASNIPPRSQIQRFKNISYEEFAENLTGQPFVLTECIQEWPAYMSWNLEEILRRYGDVDFRAEAVDWPFSTYYDYMNNTKDESPLYLFDKKFAEKMGITVGHEQGAAYWSPDCFGPDLFDALGGDRPARRWLIIGPEGSGSTFHKDPNATSAWNAVLSGRKYWIMFPPSAAVPGVFVSKDGGEVTSPLSIAEWLLQFHEEARQLPECIEGICHAGEILHVPSGWWHLVVNLEAGIALTQNFVPKSPSCGHLSNVLSFLKDKPDQVTGFRSDIEDPYGLFVDRLRETHPEVLDKALEILEKRNALKKRTWSEAVGESKDEPSGGGFSFGFGDDDDEEIP
ncbi:hypothetical protein ACRALDRAFT_2057214 [Sodiomyces alcalophilus JCM 7366]|uniref:uncharacterized protein n=1 Tax=Sodiomyces alcalophilus JCM 7366 TaxID=591952 RepID=UPI0039B54E57